MNDTTKECNRKNTYKNNAVCNTLRFGESWNLISLNCRMGRGEEEENKGRRKEKGGRKQNIFWVFPYLGRYCLGRGCQIGRPVKF